MFFNVDHADILDRISSSDEFRDKTSELLDHRDIPAESFVFVYNKKPVLGRIEGQEKVSP